MHSSILCSVNFNEFLNIDTLLDFMLPVRSCYATPLWDYNNMLVLASK